MKKVKHVLKKLSKNASGMLPAKSRTEHVIIIRGHKLTGTEKLNLPMLIKDFPRKRIASERGKSLNTINAELRLMYAQLHVSSRVNAIKLAIENGYDWSGIYHPPA